ncbi:MAG: right-handed parallel beta-helix repeat-containing protein [Flavobacteriales bacterium]|nr:right-handed parallel beta-helix repeat-containing protein [Flavobacteriales bacterium]
MSRSGKARRIGLVPWLLGVAVVAGGLVAAFSFSSSERISRQWPLGIGRAEVEFYARWLDRRHVEVGHTIPDIYRFGGANGVDACIDEQSYPGWRTRWFETDGYGDSAEVRRLVNEDGYLLRFKKEAPLKGQRRVLLLAATAEDIRAKYLETIANELDLQTPGISFVRAIGCGKELGLFRKEEWIDGDFLERRGLTGASLVKMGMEPTRPDLQFAVIDGDSTERVVLRGTIERALDEVAQGRTDALAQLVDERAAIAWLLMAWVDRRDPLKEPLWFAHQWATGRMLPIYRTPTTMGDAADDAPLAHNLLTPLLRRPTFRAHFERAQADLAAKVPALRERFKALDKAWLPVLADARAMPYARTSADATVEALLEPGHIGDPNAAVLLDRPLLFGPGHATFLHGMVLPPVVVPVSADTAGLRALAERYKLILQGDSIIFPRGKYTIDRTIEFPAGRTVVMLQGARLFMAAGTSLVCQGDLFVRGTLRNPVFIRAQDDRSPFGTIAALGSGSQHCEIGGLYISGGAGATVEGVPHTGMISLRSMGRTVVVNSVLEGTRAEAALLIHGGAVELNGVRCSDAHSDLIALEHASGVVRDVQANMKAKEGQANGLRIRSGQVAVVGGRFSGLRGAGVRIDGAAQVLVRNAYFAGNNDAITAIDRSLVHVEGNTFSTNTAALHGGSDAGARFLLYPNIFEGNGTERSVGPVDTVTPKDALEASTAVSFGVQLTEPGPEAQGTGRGSRRRRPTSPAP